MSLERPDQVPGYRVTWAVICLLLTLLPSPLAFATSTQDRSTQLQLIAGDRELTVWNWAPAESPRQGVILFSHGYASAPWKYELLIRPWVEAGYEVFAPLHVDSSDHPRHVEFSGEAIWAARLQDMRTLSAELGGRPYAAAGHSYGALIGLTLGGAEAAAPEGMSVPLADPAVTVVLAFSPPPVFPGLIPEEGYAKLSRPALIQTGTRDVPMGSDERWEQRLDAFHAAPAGGNRYALVLAGVDHYFGGAICRPELKGPKQLAELSVAADLSILMLQAYAQHNPDALEQLQRSLNSSGETMLLYK
jgi:alpha-beta hydrolase superfamily lysophospholipase